MTIGFSSASAELYRGIDYSDLDLGNDTHVWTGGLEVFVPTGYTDPEGRDIFTHYILIEDANSVTVHNGAASFVFDKNTCSASIYRGGIIGGNSIIASDSYVPKQSVNGSGVWNIVTSVNNAACVTNIIETLTSVEISGTKTSAAGVFKVTYIKEIGSPLKTILEATNLSALTDRRFGVTQTQSIPQIITFGGQQRDLADHIGQTFDRAWLENNKANLLEFSQGIKFDVIDAWDNLESISVNSVSGGMASVSFNYLRNTPILLPDETLVIDPTFTSSDPSWDAYIQTNGATGAACPTTSYTKTNGTIIDVEVGNSAGAGEVCTRGVIEWDISSTPNSIDVTDVDFSFDVQTVSNARNCDYYPMEDYPLTNQLAVNLWNDAGNGTAFVTNDATCTTTGNNKSLDLGTNADSDVESLAAGGYFGLGIKLNSETRDASTHYSRLASEEDGAATPKPTITIVYTVLSPDPVDDLTYTNLQQTSLDLLWTQPNLNGFNLTNYRVNYTSPYGIPNVFLANTTNTYYNVTGLTSGTQYSFEINLLTENGYNTNGNMINVTTTGFLELGALDDPDVTNTDDFQIFFERDDINATSLYLNVTYADTYDLSCDFVYKLARINNTYSNLTSTAVPPDQLESSFLLVNATGDIINVRCYDEITGDESKYVITLTDFEFLEQVRNLRNGTYGTAFEFGAIDGVILVVLILSMIGFNRTNPAVGVIFLVITVGALSVLGIITYPIIMYPALALLVLWAVITTRKDD